jgi:hypothetical protein
MNRFGLSVGLLAVILLSMSAEAQTAGGVNSKQRVTTNLAAPVAGVKHVIWVWFENRDIGEITAQTAPFFTSFAADNANFTNYFGVEHPSQPNYLDGFSGSNQSITDDAHHSVATVGIDNLGRQMSAKGLSWRLYAQDYPGGCSDVDTSDGGVDGPGAAGQYVRKHNPAITFESIRNNPAECANIQPLANFDPTVNFAFVVPNMINDMHDGTTAQGDAFLQAFVPLVTASPDYEHTLLIVTFDESDAVPLPAGGHVYTAAMAPWLHNVTITPTYNHFNLLSTTERIFSLAPLTVAQPIAEVLPPPQQAAPFDFDGDDRTDISIFRPTDPTGAEWWVRKSLTSQVFALHFGISTDTDVSADFTGDGKTDIAVFRPSSGQWFVLRSEDSSFFAVPFGLSGDIPMPADYDGDGKADVAVFRPSTSIWFIHRSTDSGVTFTQFGLPGDQPVAADYDGDGKADVAIFRPSGAVAGTAEWWVKRSSNGSVFNVRFGTSTDKAVPGDYTGDGKTDIAVFRPGASATWFVLRSEDFSFFSFPFGTTGDVPVPGDYDGDAKTDGAVFRPSNHTWIIDRTSLGPEFVGFGLSTDQPVPGTFVR